ncbi:MAG: DinB family protein [Saprospiraceae bacterium]|nr:DinB family protein [Saprospiraceae bacterium]
MSTYTTTVFPRPAEGDCAEYYFRYINLVPEVDILTLLHTQRDWYGDWIESLTEDQLKHRYATGKWSLAEMIGHVLDTERIFGYRMLAISRNEQKSLPGFEQDDYVRESNFNEVSAEDLANEWKAIRASNLYLARHMNSEMASRRGTANDISVRALSFPFIMAGHVIHHYRVAQEKYLATS